MNLEDGMSKKQTCRTRRRKSERRKSVSRWLVPAIGMARIRGFWILELGSDLTNPTWVIHSLATGVAVARYRPLSGTWTGVGRFAEERGETLDFRLLFDTLRALERLRT
jgi:hypothetical protein